MKTVTLLSFVTAAFVAGIAIGTLTTKQNTDTMTELKNTNRQQDEELVRKTEAAYDHAWRQGDIDGIMKCFAEDALLISPRGDVALGKEQIRNLFTDFIGNEAKGTKHTSRIDRVSFVTNDVAVADGEAFIEGAENLSATDVHHRFTDILVRTGDVWLIAHIRAYAGK